MTKEQALDGFPLDKRTRNALNKLQMGVAPLPKGVADKTRDNLVARAWIERAGAIEYKPVYRLLEDGITAMKIDDFARRTKWKSQRTLILLRKTHIYEFDRASQIPAFAAPTLKVQKRTSLSHVNRRRSQVVSRPIFKTSAASATRTASS
jgi:hypothetical protein